MLQSVKPLTRKQQVGTTLHDCRVEKKEKQVGSPYPFLRSLSLQCFWWLVFFFHFAFTCILPSVTMIWFPDKKKDGVAPWDSYCLGTKVLSNLKGLDDHMRCYWVHGVGCLVANHLPWWWSCSSDDNDDTWPLLDYQTLFLDFTCINWLSPITTTGFPRWCSGKRICLPM